MTIEFGKKNFSYFGALNPLDTFAVCDPSVDNNVFIYIKGINDCAIMVHPRTYAGKIVSFYNEMKVMPIESTLSFGYTPCIEDFE